ncbi:MAG: hypothetical protein R6V85_13060 [Polyangia bacterium]
MEFNVRIDRNPEELLDQVCAIAQDRVVVSGDTRRGRFTGMFDGNYEVSGDQVAVSIRRKPFFVSWSLVERGLGYLAS